MCLLVDGGLLAVFVGSVLRFFDGLLGVVLVVFAWERLALSRRPPALRQN